MEQGRGDIQIDFAADVRSASTDRKLVFENHHQRPIAAYLVNCLVPRDSDIHLAAQNRNYEQSLYELDHVQGGVRSGSLSLTSWSDGRAWLASGVIFLLARLGMLWRRRLSQAERCAGARFEYADRAAKVEFVFPPRACTTVCPLQPAANRSRPGTSWSARRPRSVRAG
jgi:hypothetical protein